MPSLSDYAAAAQMRDLMGRMVEQTVERFRPRYRYATVVSIDRTNRKCEVQYEGEPGTVVVNMGSIQPLTAGQVVRIDGIMGDRFISDVMGLQYEYASRIIVNSAARPGTPIGDSLGLPDPYDGMEIWEYDTHKQLFWYDNLGDWFPPWNVPWGTVAHASNAGGQTTATTSHVTVLPFSESFRCHAGRTYYISIHHNWRGSTADNIIDYDVIVNAGGADTVLRTFRQGNPVSTGTNAGENEAGTIRWDCAVNDVDAFFWCRAARLTGGGTITMGSLQGHMADMGPDTA